MRLDIPPINEDVFKGPDKKNVQQRMLDQGHLSDEILLHLNDAVDELHGIVNELSRMFEEGERPNKEDLTELLQALAGAIHLLKLVGVKVDDVPYQGEYPESYVDPEQRNRNEA